jgi:hypothetical protein
MTIQNKNKKIGWFVVTRRDTARQGDLDLKRSAASYNTTPHHPLVRVMYEGFSKRSWWFRFDLMLFDFNPFLVWLVKIYFKSFFPVLVVERGLMDLRWSEKLGAGGG